ncbi:hypothetical protein [uncultured Clostridium sp.]|uniref:hypothetical protein n=1 Tax=uncultured Clostridium sp. TaxID=59620 RepID=UPI0025E9D85B|nr:hypothetical protein [uncultured Clostridium sp.]
MINNFKKICSILLSCALLFTAFPFVSLANDRAMSVAVAKMMDSVQISYQTTDTSVTETALFTDIDGKEVTMRHVVYSNGTGFLTIIKDNQNQVINYSDDDYELFLNLANNSKSPHTRGATQGKEITGSQFKHQYIGGNNFTLLNNEITAIANGGVSTAASIISAFMGVSLPASILISLGGYAYTIITAHGPARMDVSHSTYEVLFTADNGYYIHCYHDTVVSYDSGDHKIDSTMCYSQAIGG